MRCSHFGRIVGCASEPGLFRLASTRSISIKIRSNSRSKYSFLANSSSLKLGKDAPLRFAVGNSSVASAGLRSCQCKSCSFAVRKRLAKRSPSNQLMSSAIGSS